MILLKPRALLLITAVMLMEACSGSDGNITLNLDGKSKSLKDKGYRVSSVLHRSPRILIATPKERTIEQPSSGFRLGSLFGGTQGKQGREYFTNQSPTQGTEYNSENKYSNSFSNFKSRHKSSVRNSSGKYTKEQATGETYPVVAIAYGGEATVVKSVDGGFATLLLRKGDPGNLHACNALFITMAELTNDEIAQASVDNETLSRPTYWLDRRKAPPVKKIRKKEVASAGSMVKLVSTGVKNNITNPKRRKPPRKTNCKERIKHYNFKASHSLIKRLGLFDRPGPFLVAWRDDGKKAMIAELNQLNTGRDFKAALLLWSRYIVQHPSIWEEGVLDSDHFLKKIHALISKTGPKSLSQRIPAKESQLIN